jgi:hypothetical protein
MLEQKINLIDETINASQMELCEPSVDPIPQSTQMDNVPQSMPVQEECIENEPAHDVHPSACHEIHPDVQHLMSLPQFKQRSAEWYKQRKGIMTASDFYKAMSLRSVEWHGFPKCKHKDVILMERGCSVKDYVLNKIGMKPFSAGKDGKAAMAWGNQFEDVVRMIYEVERGVKVYELGLIKHKKYANMLGASPDGISHLGRLIEIKVPFSRVITGKVPLKYYIQMQMQLACINTECSVPLDGVDFIEARFSQYRDEAIFLYDAPDNEQSEASALHQRNRDGLHKGILGVFEVPSPNPDEKEPQCIYEIPPLELPYQEKLRWLEARKAKLANHAVFVETVWWSQDTKQSVVHITYDKDWFERRAMPVVYGVRQMIHDVQYDKTVANKFFPNRASHKVFKELIEVYFRKGVEQFNMLNIGSPVSVESVLAKLKAPPKTRRGKGKTSAAKPTDKSNTKSNAKSKSNANADRKTKKRKKKRIVVEEMCEEEYRAIDDVDIDSFFDDDE